MASGPLRIWTERVGDPGLPAVLMVMGSAAQSVSCPDALVGRLVERGVQVIRFDHRDTGRSSVVDFDAHPYTIGDMARDCLAVLDGYGLSSAHVAGTSMGGVIAQWLGVHASDRVRSLTVMSSMPMGHGPLIMGPLVFHGIMRVRGAFASGVPVFDEVIFGARVKAEHDGRSPVVSFYDHVNWDGLYAAVTSYGPVHFLSDAVYGWDMTGAERPRWKYTIPRAARSMRAAAGTTST